LGGLLGIRSTLLLAALGGAIASLWLLSSPIRNVKTIENDGYDSDHEERSSSSRR
jgi:hypothetical protein